MPGPSETALGHAVLHPAGRLSHSGQIKRRPKQPFSRACPEHSASQNSHTHTHTITSHINVCKFQLNTVATNIHLYTSMETCICSVRWHDKPSWIFSFPFFFYRSLFSLSLSAWQSLLQLKAALEDTTDTGSSHSFNKDFIFHLLILRKKDDPACITCK